jgi:hypothetical protein
MDIYLNGERIEAWRYDLVYDVLGNISYVLKDLDMKVAPLNNRIAID